LEKKIVVRAKSIQFDGQAKLVLNSTEIRTFDAAKTLFNQPIEEIQKHASFAEVRFLQFRNKFLPLNPQDISLIRVVGQDDIHPRTKETIDKTISNFVQSPQMSEFLSGIFTNAALRAVDKYLSTFFQLEQLNAKCASI
jgi:hypothetical protein